MLHFGIVRPDERGLITNPLGLAAVRLTTIRQNHLIPQTLRRPAAYFLGSRAEAGRDLLFVQDQADQIDCLAAALGYGSLQSIMPKWRSVGGDQWLPPG